MNKKSIVLLGIICIVGILLYQNKEAVAKLLPNRSSIDQEKMVPVNEGVRSETAPEADGPLVEVVADSLDIPWEVLFLPNDRILITERPGSVLLINQESQERITLEGVTHIGEGGLLGAALHPNFDENKYVYLYMTTTVDSGLENRIERYTLDGDQLVDHQIIFDQIPGARYHDGGRIEFGPDSYLYITTGDAQNEPEAQNNQSLQGTILRIVDDGSIPVSNPFNSPVYSYGHRNPQGLAWDEQGRLWITEHGRSGIVSGFDEVNLIRMGGNYGWPEIEGDETQQGMINPVAHSGNSTWAPGDVAYHEGSLFFTGLRGAALYEAVLDGERITEIKEHFKNEYGRLRAVRLGPDGYLYVTTSNTDGRGQSIETDDRLLKINPNLL